MGSREQGGGEVGVTIPLAMLTQNEGGEGAAGGVNWEGDQGGPPHAKGGGTRAGHR